MGRFILYSQRAGDKINSQPDWPPPVTGYQHTHSFVTLTESGIVSDAKQTKKKAKPCMQTLIHTMYFIPNSRVMNKR